MGLIGRPQAMIDARWMKNIAKGYLRERAVNTRNATKSCIGASIASFLRMLLLVRLNYHLSNLVLKSSNAILKQQ